MKHIFIDLEFTRIFRSSAAEALSGHETIQVGAVMFDDRLVFESEFNYLVKPEFTYKIEKYESQLTGITWDMVKNEMFFKPVMQEMLKWIGTDEYTMYSWSRNDPLQLICEGEYKKCGLKEAGMFDRWIDVQAMFCGLLNGGRQMSLERALALMEIDFAGSAHDACVDAYNTARLFRYCMKLKGYKFDLNYIKVELPEKKSPKKLKLQQKKRSKCAETKYKKVKKSLSNKPEDVNMIVMEDLKDFGLFDDEEI